MERGNCPVLKRKTEVRKEETTTTSINKRGKEIHKQLFQEDVRKFYRQRAKKKRRNLGFFSRRGKSLIPLSIPTGEGNQKRF